MSTTIYDLPYVIISNIIAAVRDTRSRNAAALVCRKWHLLERLTRTHLTLRGNIRDLFLLPTCFVSVTHLDLSLLSPWGHPFLAGAAALDPTLLAHRLLLAFPKTTSLTLYARHPATLHHLSPFWPHLSHLKLVRWHQRPQSLPGSDFFSIFEHCRNLEHLDLSCFYCWTEDLQPALDAYPEVGRHLTSLNLLNFSFAEGFKAHEIEAITGACPNLRELLITCIFDPRYFGYVGDDALVAIPTNCKDLRVLHLADISASTNGRGDNVDDLGFASVDARLSVNGLVNFFSGLKKIEELALDVCKNVPDSGVALEVLASKCPNLRSLKLGQFHGICNAVGSELNGIALCQKLESLSVKGSADLTDFGLIAIGRGCSWLAKFEIHGCKNVTVRGLRTMVCLLRKSLVDVRITGCKNLDTLASLQAVEPIQEHIRWLHVDCVGFDEKVVQVEDQALLRFDVNEMDDDDEADDDDFDGVQGRQMKRCKVSSGTEECWYHSINGSGSGNSHDSEPKTWHRLQFLSLWISAGELLPPLVAAGLEECPNLEEIHIKVEGDCRERPRQTCSTFGLSTLQSYSKLSQMKLDCGDTIGYALTAPFGYIDLSLWERFYLAGISDLQLRELDYWPPQDREVNQRSLSLPAAGLLAECSELRKLFIHGTAYEHFLMFLLRIPNLRDVQLRGDYYPAPENDMSTEMRMDSCCRFEDKLNMRPIPD